jgi:hypothetical protein
MSKKKPDYTKFMRKPTPLELSPPSREKEPLPRHDALEKDDNIPWAEIILEPEQIANLVRASQIARPEKKTNIPPAAADHAKSAAAQTAPPVGFTRPVVVTDAALGSSTHAGDAYRPSFLPPGLPVAAAPPLAALMVIALVVFVLLLQ